MDMAQGSTDLAISHGFTNLGNRPSRILDVVLPGRFDNYFVALGELYAGNEPSAEQLDALAAQYGVEYVEIAV